MIQTETYISMLDTLRAQRDALNTAIAALEVMAPPAVVTTATYHAAPPAPAKVTRKAKAATKTSPTIARVPAAHVKTETPDTPDTPETPDMPETRETDRAKPGEWQERALRALSMGPGDVQVRELVTRLRVKDKDRDSANTRLWAALQALVKAGQVVKNGPRYRLARKVEAA